MTNFIVSLLLLSGFNQLISSDSQLMSMEITNDISSVSLSKSKILEAERFAKQKGMDSTVCIFIDMSIHSGKNRLFVYDFKKQMVIKSSLCAHGSCSEGMSGETAHFSNVPESHCSSKGKYKIGKRGWSNWGVHFNYKLHGLETSNSNAYDRIIVLHSYEYVEDEEVYPTYIINSWGCPMVSNNTMLYLDKVLKQAKQPVLLWIYN